uniref:Uncharacterized protein n=1 Tax=Arundo donax TaxID=35708 RepID=A0A0A9HJ16_ARUDO
MLHNHNYQLPSPAKTGITGAIMVNWLFKEYNIIVAPIKTSKSNYTLATYPRLTRN